jgi:hypothetical protein
MVRSHLGAPIFSIPSGLTSFLSYAILKAMQEPRPISEFNLPEIFTLASLRHTFLIFVFVTLTPVTIFASLLSLLAISTPVRAENRDLSPRGVQIYAALPQTLPAVAGSVISEDARVAILTKFLDMNESELLPYSSFLVTTADKYQLDWKLLPAIAQKESGLCRVIPKESHNCWGWGIHSKGTLMFDSYEEAIDTVAKGLKEKYIDAGYRTPDEIMKKYAHPDSTTWADGVRMYMEQIATLDLN